jgi:hypothetical protein
MIGPHDTNMKGNSEEVYDGMPEKGHLEQFGHANGGRTASEDVKDENRQASEESEKDE